MDISNQITNAKLLAVLTACGWSPLRCVATQRWQDALELKGFQFSDFSMEFLSSFGGLIIDPGDAEDQILFPNEINFDPLRQERGLPPIMMQRQLGRVLSPIGELSDDSSLYIDGEGRIYLTWSGLWRCAGESLEESLVCLVLCTTRCWELVPNWIDTETGLSDE